MKYEIIPITISVFLVGLVLGIIIMGSPQSSIREIEDNDKTNDELIIEKLDVIIKLLEKQNALHLQPLVTEP